MSRAQSPAQRTAAFNALIAAWINDQACLATRQAYSSDFAIFQQWCTTNHRNVIDSSGETMNDFQNARASIGDSRATMRRRMSSLSSFFVFAIDRGAIEDNPTVGVARPKTIMGNPSSTPRLTAAAVTRHLTYAAHTDTRLHALMLLLVSDGFKVGEALAVDIDDVNRKRPMTVWILRRGERSAIVLQPGSSDAIERCIGGRRSGPLFISHQSSNDAAPKRLTRFGADHLVRQLTGHNEPRITANALRRYHIDSRHGAGHTPNDIRATTGIADVRTIRRYLD
jgi:site-specific recombinase XerD